MAKTAGQLVPLKTQLSTNMSIFRFADATTDFSGSVAYQLAVFDNAGVPFTPNGLTGVNAYSGTLVPATPLTVPSAAPTLTVNNTGSNTITSGLNRYQTQQYYHVVFFDSSRRESQSMVVLANIPGPTTTGSITFTFNWPAGASGAMIYKPYNSQGFYAAYVPNTVASYTDTTSYGGAFNAGAAGVVIFSPTQYLGGNGTYNVNRYPSPSPDATSTAPTISPTSCVVTTSTTGGGFRASGYTYGYTAYNNLGETTLSPESSVANPTGTPWLNSTGTMGTVTAASSTASGSLPAGKWYYQVTAWTQNPVGSNAVGMNGFSNSNGYQNLGSGPGYTESLPSTEINITTSATGNVTLSWTNISAAAGYAIYRSRDLPAPVVSAPTTATTGGTLPASTQYFYVVTATNANGETIASNEVTQTTGSGTSTNTISLSWANVQHAYGYKVYRGTTTGGENALLTTITSGATVTYTDTGTAGSAATPPGASTATGTGLGVYIGTVTAGATGYIDAGLNNPQQNSGFQAPKVNNSIYGSATVQASWNSVSGAVGYNLYRNTAGAIANQTNMVYWNAASALTITDNANNTGTKYSPEINWTGSNNISTVGRYAQMPNNTTTVIDRVGFTVALVPGQQYRISVYNQSNQNNIYNGTTFTATSSAMQYYEQTVNYANVSYPNQFFYFYIQGTTSSATISWGPNPKPGLTDQPYQVIQSDNNTWVGRASNNVFSSGFQLGTAGRDGQVPTQVLSETASNVPMRLTLRSSYSGSTINGVKGTFLGGSRLPQFAYSANTTYVTPIKSIVPTWNIANPVNSFNNVLFSQRWATVEVSTDGGTTWSLLTNQSRFVFSSPATQLQYRYTLPQASAAMSFDRRLMSGLPTTDNTNQGNYNFFWTPDTNQISGYYWQNQNQPADMRMISNGAVRWGNVYGSNGYLYSFWAFYNFSADFDATQTAYFDGTGQNVGMKVRNDGSNGAYGGFYFFLNNDGSWGVNRQTVGSTAVTSVASGTGATNGILGQAHTLRVIAIGTHFMFFVDGVKVGDFTDATSGYQTGQHLGPMGNGVTTSFVATALSTASLSNSPTWELEYVSAYLET